MTKISKEQALRIANAHLDNANPGRWNGSGKRPVGLITFTRHYIIDDDTTLEITYVHEWNNGYRILYQLIDNQIHRVISQYKSKYICNPDDMANDIMHVCNQ